MNVRNLRQKNMLTQEELAERAGLSVGAIKQIETGKRWPRPETLDVLAKALGVSRDDMFNDRNHPAPSTELLERADTTLKILHALPLATDGTLKDVLDLLESRASKAASTPQRKA